MTNYVLLYRLEDQKEALHFIQSLKQQFPDHRLVARHGIPYFAFAARELPDVKESVTSFLKELTVTDTDYVAIYYLKNEETQKIKRLMVLGPSDLAEDDLTSISSAEHENLLSDLLDIDFMKLRFEKQDHQ